MYYLNNFQPAEKKFGLQKDEPVFIPLTLVDASFQEWEKIEQGQHTMDLDFLHTGRGEESELWKGVAL